MKQLLLLLPLVLLLSGFRSAKGRGAEVSVMGERVSFFFSMREEKPDRDKNVIWQRWQLSCDKNGTCSGLVFYKLEDNGLGTPCSISQDALIGSRYQVQQFDLAAGQVVVRVNDIHLGEGDLRISFDPKTYAMTKAEIDFLMKDDPENPFGSGQDEIRKFRMPAQSSLIKPACVFLEEGAAKLP